MKIRRSRRNFLIGHLLKGPKLISVNKMKVQFHGDAANPKLKVLHSGMQERKKTMENEDTVVIPLKTLKWWRELLDLNPQDLAPRMDEIINSFTTKPEPKTIPGTHTWHEKSRG